MHESMTPQQFRTHAHPTTPQPLRRTRSRRFTHLYGTENSEDVLEQLEALMTSHPHEDIRVKARMIRTVILEPSRIILEMRMTAAAACAQPYRAT